MVAIARVGVNLNWLVNGKEDMFQYNKNHSTISEQELELINLYCSISSELKDAFLIIFRNVLITSGK